jgi:hypothetical protein
MPVTNPLERLNGGIKRRTEVVGIFAALRDDLTLMLPAGAAGAEAARPPRRSRPPNPSTASRDTTRLQMTVGEIYTPGCAADLGDARGGVDLVALEESGTVGTVISATAFETSLAQATGWSDGGELTWTGAANAGQTVVLDDAT